MGGQPWERLDGESPPRWQAFQIYRDLGAVRSLDKVAKQLGKSNTLIERWSAQDGWIYRTEAWDRDQDRQWHAMQGQKRKEMADRHVKVAQAFMGKVVEKLRKLDPDRLSPKDLAQWLDTAAKVERMALGEPTRHEITGADGGPISIEVGLSDEERRARLEQLQKEIGKRVALPGPTRLALAAGDDA